MPAARSRARVRDSIQVMRVALLVVVLGLLAASARADPLNLEGSAELDWQSTYLHSTDGSLTGSGPRVELAADNRQSAWWSYGAFVALTHIGGDLGGTQYHIPITNGELSVFGGVRLRGWFGRYVFGTVGIGGVRIMSGPSETSSPLLDVQLGVEPVRGDHWSGRIVLGGDFYVFDSISDTAWAGLAIVYR